MDYEKLYKEALERAKKQLEGANVFDYKEGQIAHDIRTTTYAILPELKESEGEKVRKELIDFVKSRLAGFPECERFVIWLEKQGEPIDKIVKRAMNEKQRVLLTETNGDANIDWDACSLQDVKLLLEYGLDYIKKLKKQGEQKPADKVEPKFRTGDWVVCGSDIDKVERVTDRFYHFESGDCGLIKDVDEDYHLWTIQDAKDGDVLCYKDEILLYKHDIKNCTKQETTFGGFVYHCCYDGKRFIVDSLYSLTEQDKMDIHPATKEQRDLLFQKMHEAGYGWDAEKKELKKIEHKHTCMLDNSCACVTFPFKAKVKSSGIIVTIHGGQLSPDGKEWIKYQSDQKDGYKVYEPNSLELVCEDEQKPIFCHHEVNLSDCSEEYRKAYYDEWNNCNQQHAQLEAEQNHAWSEEDEQYLLVCKNALAKYQTTDKWDANIIFHWLENKLKSLKERYTWKPSEEQMYWLKWAVKRLPDTEKANEAEAVLEELLEQLKKL